MTQGVIVSIVLRGASVFLLLVAGAVGVNLIITPLYHQGGDAYPVWEALHWFMTPAVLITLAASYAEKRRIDGNGSADLKRYLEANTVFYGSVAVFLAYFWNRFMVLSPNHNGDSQIWILLGVVMPILMVVAGRRLWRSVSNRSESRATSAAERSPANYTPAPLKSN